jgi:hypothetical protein
MATLTDAEVRDLADLVEVSAHRVARRYDCVSQEDVAQEIWLWACENPDYIRAKMTDHTGILALNFYRAGMTYADREWKELVPGDWRDQYTYSRMEVSRLLPLALNPATTPGLSGQLHDGPSSKSDPAYGGGMLASIVDVRIAYRKLSLTDQDFLSACVEYDLDWIRIAPLFGLAENSAYAKYMRILDRMVTRHLGRKDD